MNEDNTSHDFNKGQKQAKTESKKGLGLFNKKNSKTTYNHSSDFNHVDKNSMAKKLKKYVGKISRWVKRNSVTTTIVLFATILTIGAIAYHFYTKPQISVLNTDNHVVAEYESKLSDLQKAVSADSGSATAHKNYAIALYVTGNLDAAKNEYEAVVKIDGKDATAYNNLGNTYRDLHKYDKAKSAYEKAIEISPTTINPYVNLANMQFYPMDDSSAAIATYKKALKAMPNNNSVSLLLGIAYEKSGKTTEAKQTFQDILSRDGKDKAAQAGLDRLNKK